MLFREHRGSLNESMRTVREVNTMSDIENIFASKNPPIKGKFSIEEYCYDARIGWDTWAVMWNGNYVGFTNGYVPK